MVEKVEKYNSSFSHAKLSSSTFFLKIHHSQNHLLRLTYHKLMYCTLYLC